MTACKKKKIVDQFERICFLKSKMKIPPERKKEIKKK